MTNLVARGVFGKANSSSRPPHRASGLVQSVEVQAGWLRPTGSGRLSSGQAVAAMVAAVVGFHAVTIVELVADGRGVGSWAERDSLCLEPQRLETLLSRARILEKQNPTSLVVN